MTIYLYRASHLKSTITFLASVSKRKSISGARQKPSFLAIISSESAVALSLGLARAVPPTNTNFRLTFLLTRLQEAVYEDLPVESIKFEDYHNFSGLFFS